MKSLVHKTLLFIVAFFVVFCAKTYTKEEINRLFEPITSKYGIKIVYEINEDFPPILIGGERAIFDIAEPIDTRTLASYPPILEEAFHKYPVPVIKEYLTAIYFAKVLDSDGLRYGGTYDAFRRIVYIVNRGNKPEDLSISTFHHEFSSVLLKRNGFFLNPWLEQNPKGFKYLNEKTHDTLKIYGGNFNGTSSDYENGFLNEYSHASYENDFNEYASMVFTYPEKFKRIMNQYPRVRAKFLIWLDFYHKIDPVFTEAYLLGN